MGPVRSQSLVDLLTELTGLQSKTMTDSIFYRLDGRIKNNI